MQSKYNNQIRVAQIIGKWLGGGVEAVVMNYYRNIDRTKIQFDFICDNDSTDIPYDEIKKLGGRVILIPPYQHAVKYHKELKRVLKEGNYKIVHSHINTLSIFSLWAAKSAGVPVRIAHSHSTTNKKEWKKNILKQILRPFSKVFATDYMCCSELSGRWMFGNKAYDNGKVFLLNNAIDLDKFKYDKSIREKKRKELKISDDTIVIGHIGRFVKQKNHDFLIDIFNEIHKCNKESILLLAGQGPLQEEIKNKVKQLNIDKNVYFLGQRSDVNELYQVFDVFLLPSLYEGLPVVGVEAQATGNLCFLSDAMTKETKVLDSTRFVSLKKSAEEWAKEILECLKEYKKHDTAKEVSKYGFNIKNEAKKLEDKYNDFLKLNICHVVSGLKSGGVESVIYNYCSNMDNSKYNWHLLYQHEPSEKSISEFKYLNFKMQRIPSKFIRPLGNYIKTKKYFKENRIDIVHCHMTLMNFIPLIAAKKCKIPIRISHSHNAFNDSNSIKKYFNLILKKLIKRNATILVSCGKDAGNYLYDNEPFIVLNNALNLDNYSFNKKKRNDIRKKLKIAETDFVIGHIGRFSYQKNHELLIHMMEKLIQNNPNFKLVLVGDGENYHNIKQLIEDNNMSDNIVTVGIVNNACDYYSAFDCFVLPSRWEGLPVVGIEAQASGLKCFFSNKIDINAQIIKEVVFLDINNIDSWCNNIESYYKSGLFINRSISLKLFEQKGLNIKSEVKKLDKLYSDNGGIDI